MSSLDREVALSDVVRMKKVFEVAESNFWVQNSHSRAKFGILGSKGQISECPVWTREVALSDRKNFFMGRMFPNVGALESCDIKLTFINWNHLRTTTRKVFNFDLNPPKNEKLRLILLTRKTALKVPF